MGSRAVARCSLSLSTATTARQPNSASQGGSSQTESLSRVTTTQRSITEGSFEQWDEEAENECGFIFSFFTTQCAIETFVVLHYYISIFVVTVDFFCSSTNH